MFKYLFSPLSIRTLEIGNRLVVPAMVMNYCNLDGSPTERYFAYYEGKAKGGWGLIITEDYAIDPVGKGYTHIPGLWSDSQVELHAELPKRIHRHGSKIIAQIYHAGRQTNHDIIGERPVAPSPIPCPTKKEMPHELSIEEIEALVEKFGDCASRAKKAGFDGVEIHGAHGYLVAEFLSSYSNKRTDRYGGGLINRFRFAREVISNIRAKAGNSFPVLFRISGDEFIAGGRTIEETRAVALLLQEAGVDAIHVSAGVYGSRHAVVPPARIPQAWIADLAWEVKKVVSLPVITVGRIIDPLIAESILASGKADLVAMGRASIADPELPNKAAAGRFDEIIYCVGCMQGCAEKIRKRGQPAGCMLNPLVGRETEYLPRLARQKRKVLIAGGGVAGMEAAIVSAKRGHDVQLFEKDSKLGGAYRLAAVPPGKGEITSFIAWQQNQISKLGVTVHLNEELSVERLEKERPDVVIVATGSEPVITSIPGIDRQNVLSANDVLSGKVTTGDRVIVLGGGVVGSETANHLAHHDKAVTIVEMTPDIATDEELNTRYLLLEDLKAREVRICVNAKVTEILDDGVLAVVDGKQMKIGAADTIVLALGSRPSRGLYERIKDKGFKVVNVGDSVEVRKAIDAIEEGYKAGLEIE
jgi:2,4-dienoyl-CoA reductase-like NADH-dependent reductase (Old Yellow Enzyme family)/thioredoxin reductase